MLAVSALALGAALRGGSPPAPSATVLPAGGVVAGEPRFQALARHGGVTLYVPIDQKAITAIVYHGVDGSPAYPLDPIGQQANAGLLRRLVRGIFGDGSGGVRYDVADGRTQAVDIGAPAGTEVYAPVSGVVMALPPDVVDGDATRYGVTVGIQPTEDPSVVVDVSHVMLDPGADGSPALRVGQRVERGRTRLGTVVDLGGALQPVLRRYVSDSGNNVAVEVDPAPSVSTP